VKTLKKRNLDEEIQEAIDSKQLPSVLNEQLDAV